MATVVLIRHGRTTANSAGVLAGRSAGVHLDATGREQADRAGERLAGVPLHAVISSPLVRCRETAAAVLKRQPGRRGEPLSLITDPGLTECDYGEWTGRKLAELAKEPLWRVVQQQPAAVTFPAGESLAQMQHRGVTAVRAHDARVDEATKGAGVWAAVSHGDVIKAVVADALGLHLDSFQRIHIDPASITIVRYTEQRPMVLGVNTHEGSLAWLAPRGSTRRRRRGDAAVGGGAGPGSR